MKVINDKLDGRIVEFSEVEEVIYEEMSKGGYEVIDAVDALVTCYVENLIGINSLTGFLDYAHITITPYFKRLAPEMKELLIKLDNKLGDKQLISKAALTMFVNRELTFQQLDTLYALLLQGFEPAFKLLNEEAKINYIKKELGILDKVTPGDQNYKMMQCLNGLDNYSRLEVLIAGFEYKTPFDFIIDYMQQHNIDDKVLTDAGLDRRKKYKLARDGIKKKVDCYRLIFILDLTLTEAKQFMTLCGFCFSPLIDTDIFFMNYLNGVYPKVKTLYDLTKLSRNYCYENFDYTPWN